MPAAKKSTAKKKTPVKKAITKKPAAKKAAPAKVMTWLPTALLALARILASTRHPCPLV